MPGSFDLVGPDRLGRNTTFGISYYTSALFILRYT